MINIPATHDNRKRTITNYFPHIQGTSVVLSFPHTTIKIQLFVKISIPLQPIDKAAKNMWFSSITHKILYSNSSIQFILQFQSLSHALFYFFIFLYISLFTFHSTGKFCSHCTVRAAHLWLKSYLSPSDCFSRNLSQLLKFSFLVTLAFMRVCLFNIKSLLKFGFLMFCLFLH